MDKYSPAKSKRFLATIGVLSMIILIALIVILHPVISFVTGLINPSSTPRTELPIQIRLISSADWTNWMFEDGENIKEWKIVSYSPEATQATFDGTMFTLAQPLERAEKNTIEMVISFVGESCAR